MYITLDDGKRYDLLAMFIPRYVGYKLAYEALKLHYSTWKNAATLPFRVKPSFVGTVKWLLTLILHTVSLLLLPFLFVFACSMKAYTHFLSREQAHMAQYKADLTRIYAELSSIEDSDEYQRRLREEIAKVKPFNP